jgi:hypothetical protein
MLASILVESIAYWIELWHFGGLGANPTNPQSSISWGK